MVNGKKKATKEKTPKAKPVETVTDHLAVAKQIASKGLRDPALAVIAHATIATAELLQKLVDRDLGEKGYEQLPDMDFDGTANFGQQGKAGDNDPVD